ncbi:uncharacterized protein LOC121053270 [Oryza brachyantha]|uniref:uncharacterized protein LOC121053270 n=1 Tax=Oryza brachyantha TaxID=4533 RepID=UPI001ADB0BFB|nr:uncharacterized protein LOC121053270 [Oryza brachyantha]
MATTAGGEELYESEVLWPDHQSPRRPHGVQPPARATATPARRGQTPCAAAHAATGSSRPVDIPRAAARQWSGGAEQADDDGGCGTMVPPHVMVSRRRSESEGEAFSLRSGTGRARRDLSHLRNSVLRMTGFIEG